METLQWAVTLILGVPSALLIALNWVSFIGWGVARWRGHKGGHSFAPPFLCGIAGAGACLICPLPEVGKWAWLPLLLDPSIAFFLAASVLHVVARLTRQKSPFDRAPPQDQPGETSRPPKQVDDCGPSRIQPERLRQDSLGQRPR